VESLMTGAIAVLTGCGVYLVLRARIFPVILGVMLLGYAANLFLLAMGRLSVTTPPIIVEGAERYADPLPQALVLTAIVIGFGMAAFLVVLALKAALVTGTDHVDGSSAAQPPEER
jgi:multicomponent K+:H+ antiporter subunit C